MAALTSSRTEFAFLHVLSFVVLCACISPTARAQDRGGEASLDETNRAQVERLRAEIANQMQLRAFDLLDELVFSWLEAPPFAVTTPVVLADVVTPVSYGSGLEALIENHLAQLLIKNPKTNVQLAHCPACNALVVHSGPTGTIIGRGVDQPKALSKLRGDNAAEYALFVDVEAEGVAMVIRARITRLVDTLPIVYARTLSSRTSSAPLLRKSSELKSATAARDEYLAVLDGRGPITIPVRAVLSVFAPGRGENGLGIPTPVPWLQGGGEMALSSARAWTGSLMVGASFVPALDTGLMVQTRISRLLTGTTFSLTRPNVYLFLGAALYALQGPTATILVPPVANANPLQQLVGVLGSIATFPSLQTGMEMRVSNRIGASFVLELMPTLQTSDNVGDWIKEVSPYDFGVVQVNSFGVEVTFAF